MIIIEADSHGILLSEEAIDRLFGDTPKGMIARIVSRHGDPFSSDTRQIIERNLKSRFPREWQTMKYFLSTILSQVCGALKADSETKNANSE